MCGPLLPEVTTRGRARVWIGRRRKRCRWRYCSSATARWWWRWGGCAPVSGAPVTVRLGHSFAFSRLSRIYSSYGKKQNAGFGKGPFCKVHAGARLFRQEKVALLRPSARLGASTEITKKKLHGLP